MVESQDNLFHNQNSISVGTANFGQNYGLNQSKNGLGKKQLNEIFEIILGNVNISLDTSPSYGDSEKIVGLFLKQNHFQGGITTKIPSKLHSNPYLMVKSLENSLKVLGIPTANCTFLHGYSDAIQHNYREISSGLKTILKDGLSEQVGLSCYTEQEIVMSKKLIPELSVFQLPENILDQRLRNSEIIRDMRKKADQFYVRSIFLQGNLLVEGDKIPDKLFSLKEAIRNIDLMAARYNLSKLEYCISYVKSLTWSSGFVVGVDSGKQLQDILSASKRSYAGVEYLKQDVDQNLIDPRMW